MWHELRTEPYRTSLPAEQAKRYGIWPWPQCRFSGCHEPYARSVKRGEHYWDLCDEHASRMESQ